jgi:hypothetical protein
VQRWIVARLRNHQFFSLEELNRAIHPLLFEINHRLFKKLPGTRYEQFMSIDKPALKPLPETDYEYAKFKITRVNRDYHVEIDKHYYSVPYLLVREEVDVRWTSNCVEIFHNGQRVAIHQRSTLLYTHGIVAWRSSIKRSSCKSKEDLEFGIKPSKGGGQRCLRLKEFATGKIITKL